MPEITTMFWDVGGVMLSNGWDADARAAAMRKFNIDAEDFEARHKLVDEAWECGSITLGTYLERAIFYRPRAFTADEFRDFMFAQSQDLPAGHRIADELAKTGRYLMFTLNNEAVELNIYRIKKFGLRKSFSAFFSSCFLGARKPGPEIYRRALDVTQRLLHALRDTRYLSSEGIELRIMASFGIASYPEDGSSIQEIIGAADQMMYLVKNSARGNIAVAQRGFIQPDKML